MGSPQSQLFSLGDSFILFDARWLTMCICVRVCVCLFRSPSWSVSVGFVYHYDYECVWTFEQQLLLLMVSYRCRSRCRYSFILLVLYCISIYRWLLLCIDATAAVAVVIPTSAILGSGVDISGTSMRRVFGFPNVFECTLCVCACMRAQRCYLWTFLLCALDLRAFIPLRWTLLSFWWYSHMSNRT